MTSHFENISRGALGMCFLILVCYLLSNNKKAINWKLVGIGIFAQVMFAMGVLNTKIAGQPVFWVLFGAILLYIIFNKLQRIVKSTEPFNYNGIALAIAWQLIFFFGMIRSTSFANTGMAILLSIAGIAFIIKFLKRNTELLKWSILANAVILCISIYTGICNPDIFKVFLGGVSSAFVELLNLSHKGTEFLFGSIADDKQSWGYIFAVQVLPNIIFFAALSSILYYLGILQKIVYVFAYLLNKMNISGAESLSTAANIFLGQTEAPLMIRPYLEKMTRSEILCIMVGGMANTAGSVLAAYVGFLGGSDPAQQNYFALHMLSQSIMSAPAAIVCSKLLFPQAHSEEVSKDLTIPKEKLGDNFLDALSLGTTDGLKLAVNVGAMLIVFTAMMYVVNALLGWAGNITNVNAQIAAATGGRYNELSLQMIFGYVFAPVAWLIGVAKADMVAIGQLLGEKTILNEFVAYISLGKMKAGNVITDPKSLLIATYALCGFANFASIGIQIGGISQLAPNQRRNLTELGVKALIGGTIACLMCGCIAGMLM
ncbi:Na+ dependent nucleoside transporter [Terrimonas sp.]|uniref:nucleoside transporter C-terminal domain-containing protein n=1 Tax=Terrimonas sp. TaxID=1914338 RepID=UPI000D50EC1E|nr:nucleoside transporter C-terminal domain-containing protein [Terrimonas sp.]PVD53090.1 Na+ dependent nucleoside transporter [Terrimonas sp.]